MHQPRDVLISLGMIFRGDIQLEGTEYDKQQDQPCRKRLEVRQPFCELRVGCEAQPVFGRRAAHLEPTLACVAFEMENFLSWSVPAACLSGLGVVNKRCAVGRMACLVLRRLVMADEPVESDGEDGYSCLPE